MPKCKEGTTTIKKDMKVKKTKNIEIEKEYIEEVFDEVLEDTPNVEYSSWIRIR